MAETLDHLALKRLAVAWLWRLGCRVVATEVQCPIGRYRIDVAGWFDRPVDGVLERVAKESATLWAHGEGRARSTARGPEAWRTVIIECKQARADFMRDDGDPEGLLRERARLERRRREIEETKVKRFEPELRQEGSSLFSELESWDYSKSKLASYRTVLRELSRVDDGLYGQTKFARFARYRLADRLVLFTPAGLVRPKELPTDWGLVECHRRPLRRGKADLARGVDPLADLPLREQVAPPPLASHPSRRERLFRTIAMAASREAVRRLAPEALVAPSPLESS
ncbi:MAG: hypothetical protein SGJ09_16025 [Phycisphaerae bacterium]|nr:hypothetical protein [Phycisphaerae bacterium]